MIESEPELYQNDGKFGPIPGIPVGTTWRKREDCAKDGMHRARKAGIYGGSNGAYAIAMSGGYDDDDDKGEEILYTGTGGNEEERKFGGGGGSWGGGSQIRDQDPAHPQNNAMFVSWKLGKPVRVIRGANLKSIYAPYEGYRYDGIYIVTEAYTEKSKDGFLICRFKLRREPGQPPIPIRR